MIDFLSVTSREEATAFEITQQYDRIRGKNCKHANETDVMNNNYKEARTDYFKIPNKSIKSLSLVFTSFLEEYYAES